MSAHIGVELGPDVVRAVRLERWGRRVRTLEYRWDPAAPAEAAAALRDGLGSGGRLALTVDLSFLFAKQVRLPPVPAAEKRRILSLEPERFFPVRAEELVLALRAEDNLVFAARAQVLESWLAALESVAAVELVEAVPVSLARVLGRTAPGAATLALEEKDAGVGLVEVGSGKVRRVRRIRNDPEEVRSAVTAAGANGGRLYLRPLNGNRDWRPGPDPGTNVGVELPPVAGLASTHLAAYGAALGLGGDLSEALLPPDLAARIRRRRARALAGSVAACAAALAFSLLALDGYRGRTLAKLDTRIAAVRAHAEGVLALERQADALAREEQAVATIQTERLDPTEALAALTRRLPAGSYILALRGSGREWQIDGYAREAAPLVPRLEEDPRFEDVHFLGATSRTRLNGTVYESFSIALRLVPAP
ncbi:MAG: PilN domain-containing protein [Gemmatimonadales bacterium]